MIPINIRHGIYIVNVVLIILAVLTFDVGAMDFESDHTLNCHASLKDTVVNNDKGYVKDLILPGSLIAVGTVGVWAKPFKDLNKTFQNGMTRLRGDHFIRIDEVAQYVPVSAYLAMGALGVNCKHSFRERFMAGATAYLAMGIMVNSVKYTVKEKRPDASTRNSYPSGHTATVFMGAELIRQEYGLGISIAAYTAAVGVGFLRMYNNRHWFNDVIGGAGVGILCARIGYWMLPLYRKWFHWDKTGTTTAIMPGFNSVDRSVGINLVANF